VAFPQKISFVLLILVTEPNVDKKDVCDVNSIPRFWIFSLIFPSPKTKSMKKFYSFLFIILSGSFLFAKDVDVTYAMQVATNFYLQNSHETNAVSLSLVYTCRTAEGVGTPIDGKPVYYVFDVAGNHGFVIVSGDDLVEPVLGYNTSGSYPVGHLNPSITKWMENYKKQIIYVKEFVHETTDVITGKWQKYYNNIPVIDNGSRGAQSVNPLCQTQWNQAPNENGMCPFDNAHGERAVTGCVATAMSQIMKFWNYPTQGVGYHSYNDDNYGTQAANFGNTTYNWSGMPNTLSGSDLDVATLMYHCGVSVDMHYGVGATGGSSAYVVASQSPVQACAEYSYKTYFGYDPATLQGIVRDNYSDASWTSVLKGELDAGRPIQYAGFGQGGGHTWVCDGYDQNDFFHQNWGWGGNSDGFFSLSNLDPAALGAGGGTGGFNSGQQAVIGIKPLNNGGGGGTINQGGIVLYAATTVTANPVQAGGSFTVYSDIANTGATNFTGDLAAAIFDNKGVFIQYIQTYTNQTLQTGFHYPVDFTVNPLALIPGTYSIGLYYKNSSSNYSLIDNGAFFNPVTITVTGPYNDIQVTSATSLTPAVFIKNQAVSVDVQMGNAGTSDFNGWLSADLYSLDGNWGKNIDEFAATLNAQNNYQVTFTNSGLNVAPGTYLIAFWSTLDQVNYSLVYGTTYPNPVEVTIVEAGLFPDAYEVNNTESDPYNFYPTFNGSNASVLTTGSNMHVGNDYDYYNINLPPGTNYSITARVHDSYSSGNGQSYTNDAQFSYKVNTGAWSNTYDDVMGGPIYVAGGGTVTFFVADYFQGSVGTYLLDLQIVSGANVGINDISLNNVSVYPNPAQDVLFIDAGDAKGSYTMKMFNTLGEEVKAINSAFTNHVLRTDVSSLASGIYTLQLKTEAGISTSKFIIK
jgi:hypothetical protein